MESLRSRILLAIALTVAFYALAITIAAALLAGPALLWASSGNGNIWVTIACAGAGIAVLQSIIPPRDSFEAPGLELTRQHQPAMFALLDDVARAAGDTPPDAVFLDLDINAAVFEHRRKRFMILGLPLLATLGEDELRAVIAHEHGHYVGGDTRFSRWIWRTRVAVLRTAQALAADERWFRRVIVSWPFKTYARLFLRITNAVSRRQEYAADALAARVTSPGVAANALRRIEAAAPYWGNFWQADVVPMLEAELRPPVASGFRQMLGHHEIVAAINDIARSDTLGGEPDPYASHPTLSQRLEALGQLLDGRIPAPPARVAADVLSDIASLEQQLFVTRFGNEVGSLPPADWSRATEVHRRRLEDLTTRFGGVIDGSFTVADAAELATRLIDLRHRLRALLSAEEQAGVDDRQLDGLAFEILAAATILALVTAGAQLSAAPGEPLRLTDNGKTLDVHERLAASRAGELTPEQWRADPTVARLGSALLGPTRGASGSPGPAAA